MTQAIFWLIRDSQCHYYNPGRRRSRQSPFITRQFPLTCGTRPRRAVPMETPSLDTEVRVMFFDTDAGGLVHNIAYLRFIETNRSLLAEKLGWPLGEMLTKGDCPVLV